MKKIVVIFMLLFAGAISNTADAQNSDRKNVYWEQLSDEAKKEVVSSDKIDVIVADYYQGKFKFSDDDKSFRLLDVLTSKPEDGNIKALYFYLFNDACTQSDGAISEVMGDYCMGMIVNDPVHVLTYFVSHDALMETYALFIGYELYFKEEGVSDIKYNFDSFKKFLSGKIGDDEGLKRTLTKFNSVIEEVMKSMD